MQLRKGESKERVTSINLFLLCLWSNAFAKTRIVFDFSDLPSLFHSISWRQVLTATLETNHLKEEVSERFGAGMREISGSLEFFSECITLSSYLKHSAILWQTPHMWTRHGRLRYVSNSGLDMSLYSRWACMNFMFWNSNLTLNTTVTTWSNKQTPINRPKKQTNKTPHLYY